MRSPRVRHQIAWEAARLMLEFPQLCIASAKVEATRRIAPAGAPRRDLPSDAEVGRQYHGLAAPPGGEGAPSDADRYARYQALLVPLENVRQNPRYHPEGDALYHSLQVFDHARDHDPYDAELLAAALLHDVGKAIDRHDHEAASARALRGLASERTLWLIENHMRCHELGEGKLGARAKRRLQQSPWWDELVLLSECDRAGRRAGVEAPELEEALEYLREVEG
ncbi:HD domain protein [Pirellulimonas nuda]|uniref:HD domain protein n=1 Tax=Pirellulimonas nuda TaxID=2528009 RepID=A0A518DGM0_9BACT|nr:HD domain-containing protein [Pirellulimonas nuda]QDU90623.1 HD domain protein [Pirellulimonas nuda]